MPGEEKPAFEYDVNNRLIKGAGTSYEYDAANNATKISGLTPLVRSGAVGARDSDRIHRIRCMIHRIRCMRLDDRGVFLDRVPSHNPMIMAGRYCLGRRNQRHQQPRLWLSRTVVIEQTWSGGTVCVGRLPGNTLKRHDYDGGRAPSVCGRFSDRSWFPRRGSPRLPTAAVQRRSCWGR